MHIEEDKLVTRLMEAGLTGYESKAYLSLVRLGRAKVMPLARASGIPRNKLYHVLESLTEMGLAQKLADEPLEYAPRPLAPFVERRVKNMEELLEEIGKSPVLRG
jgi:sugar-specific transcriptional regulator TrmB